MALLSVVLPPDVARLLSTLDVPGERASDHHVTLVYPGKTLPFEASLAYIGATNKALSGLKPFTVTVNAVGTFAAKDGKVPVVAKVEGEALHDLRERLVKALDEASVEYDTTYKDYRPHVTLAFAEAKDVGFMQTLPSPVTWGVSEVAFWGGSEGASGIQVTFPLLLAKRVASNYLRRGARYPVQRG